MAAITASASLQFIIILLMVAFSVGFCQAIDNSTGLICNNSNGKITVCEGVKGLNFSNVSMVGSTSSPRTSSSSSHSTKSPSSIPRTRSPTTGGTTKSPPSSNDGSDDSSKSVTSPVIISRPSLQALALVFSFVSFLFFVICG